MTIRISKGPTNGSSPYISFLGVTADGTSCSSQYNLISNIGVQLNATIPDAIDIVNLELTSQAGGLPVYELEAIALSEWRDEDNLPFNTIGEVMTYIITVINEFTAELELISHPPVGLSTTTIWAANNPINFQFVVAGTVSYYWNESNFPAGLSVSIFDNRIITGTVVAPGVYPLQCELANNAGITTDILTLEVV